jgi:hypothetical protein
MEMNASPPVNQYSAGKGDHEHVLFTNVRVVSLIIILFPSKPWQRWDKSQDAAENILHESASHRLSFD